MFSRPLILAALLGAAIAVPYFMSRSSGNGQQGAWPFSLPAQSPAAPAAVESPNVQMPADGPGALVYDSPAPLEGARMHSLGDVLRFDVTKEWVYRNWARKSTGLTDPELFGVRVPLVTGTGMTDVAGSLTYYFNAQGQAQHITLLGRTADTTQLIQFLVKTYDFQRTPSPAGQQLYQVTRNGKVQSQLRTRPEPVLWATSPHESFAVELELERPGSSRYLPPSEPRLAIPEVASASAPAASGQQPPADGGTSSAAESDDGEPKPSLVGKVRPATPKEQRQVLWMRWPN